MIEVFKTNMRQKKEAKPLVKLIANKFPVQRIDFDLQDCDKILRVEGESFSAEKIISMLAEKGFQCSILE